MSNGAFKHVTEVRVRNYEVDWQGIVHNANYLLYFETARMDYLMHVGIPIGREAVGGDFRVVLVRNEIDYRSPARYNETLVIRTRVLYIQETSFAFGAVMTEKESGRLVAENVAVHVWLDDRTGEPKRVPDTFRKQVRAFEGDSVGIREPKGLA